MSKPESSTTTSKRVWLSETGDCFHDSPGCMGGQRLRTTMALADVAALTDREPCGTCVGDTTTTLWRQLRGEQSA